MSRQQQAIQAQNDDCALCLPGFTVSRSREWSGEILKMFWQEKGVYLVKVVNRNVRFDEEKNLNQIKVGENGHDS